MATDLVRAYKAGVAASKRPGKPEEQCQRYLRRTIRTRTSPAWLVHEAWYEGYEKEN